MNGDGEPAQPQIDAAVAAALLALDPHGLGGAALRGAPGPGRDAWLATLAALLGEDAPWRRLPAGISEGRLLGGLDLAATLTAGRPVAERGLLAQADGGLIVIPMAERLPPAVAAQLGAALDQGEIVIERDGVAMRAPARFGVVALDEGEEDEAPPASLMDRLAFWLEAPQRWRAAEAPAGLSRAELAEARRLYAGVSAAREAIEALALTAAALGVDSARATLLALRAARASAALEGRDGVDEDDLTLAARLVLAPRATRTPMAEDAAEPPPEKDDPPPEPSPGEDDDASEPDAEGELKDALVAAALAAIPADLMARLIAGGVSRRGATGKSGQIVKGAGRGRPAGVRRGDPRRAEKLSVVETLRAAAPWQGLRRREAPPAGGRVLIRADDFRVTRMKRRAGTVSIFAVDASGSQALNRLAEAKGAVELLLAQSYVRRDQVALIAFRGTGAELLLPPTRSLARAKRCLASLPGGGGTPLAAGIEAAALLADSVKRKGLTPAIILLTDGRGNVARDGTQGRAGAAGDALAAARALRASGVASVLIDTSPKPQPEAARLADAMCARYFPLPHAGAAALVAAIRLVAE